MDDPNSPHKLNQTKNFLNIKSKYNYMYEYVNIKNYNYSDKFQNIETLVLSLAAFMIPLFLGHQQLLVGSVVNAFLITAGMHLKGYRILPIILLPSIGALSAGLLFGPLSKFLLFMIPFIWISNSLLVFTFRFFRKEKNKNYWITLLIGTILKSGLLFSAAFILYSFNIVPVIFLTAMGILQIYTALIGGVIAFGYEKTNQFLAK